MQVKNSIEITANRTIDVLENGLAYYNYEGNHFRLFATKDDALAFLENNDDTLVIKEFDNDELLDKYLEENFPIQKETTQETTELELYSVLKAIIVKDDGYFELGKFYKIVESDGVVALLAGGRVDFELRVKELGIYFKHIATIDDIENLEEKAFLLKEAIASVKEELKPLGLDIIEMENTIIHKAIEKINGDKIELQFICDNIDITMVEKCSCCGKFLMPNDECYENDLNDGAALCDHCSVFDEGRDMYIKSVRQDVIEKITGYKFSPHIGNVGSTIEEFNHWLNRYKLAFSYLEESSKQNLIDFINGCTEFSTCDSCKLIEKSFDLKWVTSGDFVNDENVAVKFALATLNVDALCQVCIDAIIKRTKLDLHEVVQRIRENQMVYRVGDVVVLENVNFEQMNISKKTYIDYIVSLDETKKTYKLKEYGDIEFSESDFFDIANEAYVSEYTKFIASQHPDLSEDVDQWSITTDEGFPEIKTAFEEFGYKDEFIEHLKANNLPYGKLLTPKFKIGDEFKIHFNHYDDSEVTTHKIAKIDTSFTEIEDIVYWSDEYVFISEELLLSQKSLENVEFDEVLIVKNDILHNFFLLEDEDEIVVPTYMELFNAKKILPQWKLCEKYRHLDFDSLIFKIDEKTEDFFTTLEVLNAHKEKFRKSKKYAFREAIEFGTPIEVVNALQTLDEVYSEKELNSEPQMVVFQANITTEDYSSIEIVLDFDVNESELSHYLKSTVHSGFHDEIDMLIDVIKQAKADNHNTLYVYDC